MRFIALSITTVALSGCAWMGSSPASYHHNGYQNHYAPQQGYNAPSRTHFEGSISGEDFTGGNITPTAIETNGQTLNKIAYKDAYKTGWRATGGFSQDVAPRTSLTIDGFYKKAEAEDTPISIGTAAGGAALTGTFSDYKSYGAEIGFREYLNNAGAGFRPYVGATVGGAYNEAIDIIEPTATPATAGIGRTRLHDGGWVPTASALVGFEFATSRNAALGLESGLRYEGKRDIELSNTFGKADDRYSVPLKLRGRFRF